MSTTEIDNSKLPFFLTQNPGLRRAHAEDELLHPASFKDLPDDSATETQYFGFSIPAEEIHALGYMWHHPNLRIVSGGIFVYRGIKQTTPHAEICDYRCFMSDAALKNDLTEYRLDNGYGVRILEPLKRIHLTYADPARDNAVDVVFEAVQEAVMFADAKHFEQAMSVKGTLSLRGKRYNVDGFNVRDRSWGKPRPEKPLPVPPTSWMTGVFSADFAFNCCVLDQASNNPRLSDRLTLPDNKTLSSGWVYRDGILGRTVRATKRVERARGLPFAKSIELQFSDDQGRDFDLRGTLVASCPFPSVVNKYSLLNLMRWECDGLTAYGDAQESYLTDYMNLAGD